MKLSVLALDYDGTIAEGDRLDPAVRAAIADVRTHGITVLLVTGRILDELRRIAGDLHFVDGVVAENGAVLHFPNGGGTSLLAPPVPEAFVAELRRRRIPCTPGACLVDCAADDALRVLEAIRHLELPLTLAFNRSRVMTVAQGVSKATGLRAALTVLRLSPRNTLAVGDAENDHPLLELAEVGAAVAWGSPALRSAADVTVDGPGPAAVADFIRALRHGRLPRPARARRRLRLGHTEDGVEFALAVHGRNMLVAGDAKSGKSWLTGLLCEQLILYGYSICVIDPEGDYRSLEAMPGVSVLGSEDPPPTPRDLLRALRYPDRSVVLDLSRLPHDQKVDYIRSALRALAVMRRRTGLPHRVIVDEAHYFLHDEDATELIDFDRFGYTFVTYCASQLPEALLDATEVMLVTCESSPFEIDALFARCAPCQAIEGARAEWAMLGRLALGQAVALPVTEEAAGQLKLFTLGPRLTPHVRHREKYVDVPVTEGRAFHFSANGGGPRRIRTLRELVAALERSAPQALDPYLARRDFSRWIAEVFGDRALAEDLRKQEQRYAAGRSAEIIREMAGAVRSRYDLTEDEPQTGI